MKLAVSPAIAISSSTAIIVVIAVLFILRPLSAQISERRLAIDSTRALIESLAQQQRNIENVSRNFTQLTEQDAQVESAFLSERSSVDFFNNLDTLGDSAGITNFQKRLDQANQQSQQLIGLHLTFDSTFASTLSFLQGLAKLDVIVSVQTMTVTRGSGTNDLTVSVDALVPWETTI